MRHRLSKMSTQTAAASAGTLMVAMRAQMTLFPVDHLFMPTNLSVNKQQVDENEQQHPAFIYATTHILLLTSNISRWVASHYPIGPWMPYSVWAP